MVADLMVNAYTTTKFMRTKTFCQEKYRRMSEACNEELGKEMIPIQANDKTPLRKAGDENDEEAEV